MKSLSKELADLSVRAAKLETNAKALEAESKEKLDTHISSLKSKAESSKAKLEADLKGAGEEVADVWAETQAAIKARAEKVKAFIGDKIESLEEGHATRRADRMEKQAVAAIEFALVALDDAEYSVAQAIVARLEADGM